MATTDRDNPSPTSSRKCNKFLDFLRGMGLDVELWTGVENPRPGVMAMRGGSAERDGGVNFGEFSYNIRFHDYPGFPPQICQVLAGRSSRYWAFC